MFYNFALLKSFAKRDFKLLGRVSETCQAVGDYSRAFPKKSRKVRYRCHSICYALVRLVPGLRVQDGTYLGFETRRETGRLHFKPRIWNHSWLQTPSGAVIDAYPIGFISFGGPIIVASGKRLGPFGTNYYVPDERAAREFLTKKVRRETEILHKFIVEALEWRERRK